MVERRWIGQLSLICWISNWQSTGLNRTNTHYKQSMDIQHTWANIYRGKHTKVTCLPNTHIKTVIVSQDMRLIIPEGPSGRPVHSGLVGNDGIIELTVGCSSIILGISCESMSQKLSPEPEKNVVIQSLKLFRFDLAICQSQHQMMNLWYRASGYQLPVADTSQKNLNLALLIAKVGISYHLVTLYPPHLIIILDMTTTFSIGIWSKDFWNILIITAVIIIRMKWILRLWMERAVVFLKLNHMCQSTRKTS